MHRVGKVKKKGELAFSQIVLEMHMHGAESVPTRDELAFSGSLFVDQQKLDGSWPHSIMTVHSHMMHTKILQ